jgi:membrane-associated phospholipid phosphatase
MAASRTGGSVPPRSKLDGSKLGGSKLGGWTAIAATSGFLVLAVAVRLGRLQAWDAHARQWFRPDDGWGSAQLRADVVVDGLRPARMLSVLAVLVVVFCLTRRSWRPALIAAVAIAPMALLTLLTKLVLARPDPHQPPDGHGASFPSGHTAAVALGAVTAVGDGRSRPTGRQDDSTIARIRRTQRPRVGPIVPTGTPRSAPISS